MRIPRYIIISTCCIAVSVLGIVAGYNLFTARSAGGLANNLSALSTEAPPAPAVPVPTPASTPTPYQPPADEPKVTAGTRMIYEYVYQGDGQVETTEELSPYFLIGVTENQLKEKLAGWDVVSFSPEEVLMRKTLPGKSVHYYLLGVEDGYVAVYYQSAVNGTRLKEITDTPVSVLSKDEQARLEHGIQVIGDENLARVLEDYGS